MDRAIITVQLEKPVARNWKLVFSIVDATYWKKPTTDMTSCNSQKKVRKQQSKETGKIMRKSTQRQKNVQSHIFYALFT